MSKDDILRDMLAKNEAYITDHMNEAKWQAYVDAWRAWRQVKGDS